jgi:hypothetical protein
VNSRREDFVEDDDEYERMTSFSKVVSEVISRDTEFARLQFENDAFKLKSILKENEERTARSAHLLTQLIKTPFKSSGKRRHNTI